MITPNLMKMQQKESGQTYGSLDVYGRSMTIIQYPMVIYPYKIARCESTSGKKYQVTWDYKNGSIKECFPL